MKDSKRITTDEMISLAERVKRWTREGTTYSGSLNGLSITIGQTEEPSDRMEPGEITIDEVCHMTVYYRESELGLARGRRLRPVYKRIQNDYDKGLEKDRETGLDKARRLAGSSCARRH